MLLGAQALRPCSSKAAAPSIITVYITLRFQLLMIIGAGGRAAATAASMMTVVLPHVDRRLRLA